MQGFSKPTDQFNFVSTLSESADGVRRYTVQHKLSKRSGTLKVVPFSLGEPERQMMLRERDIVLELKSVSSVVSLVDNFDDDENTYILIEQPKGKCIKDFMAALKFSNLFEEEVKRCILQVMQIVTEIHRNKIFH